MQHQDPNRDLKLTLGIAASGALALSPMALPSHALTAVVPSALAFGGAVASIAKANEYEQADRIEADARERWQALKADMDDAMLVSSQAFYTHNPAAWIEGRNVPAQWHTEYLRARFAPLPELQPSLSQPVPQTSIAPMPSQATPIQQPGQTRGGSFDVADGFAPQHPGAPSAFDSFVAPNDDAWLDTLLNPSALLIFGGDGSGKTTFAQELARRRCIAGHEVIALDPHGSPAKWPGCTIVGAGLQYSQIVTKIGQFHEIVRQRHQAIASGQAQEKSFPELTVIAEEMTDWSAEVANASDLLTKAGHYRKVNCHLLLVAHGDKLSQIGAPKGYADMVETVLTKVRLHAKPGTDGRPIPAGKGEVRHVGGDWFPVTVPQFTQTATSISSNRAQSSTASSFEPDTSKWFDSSSAPSSTLEPRSETPQVQPEPEAVIPQRFAEFKSLGMNKAQIIFAIWQVRKGNSSRYRMASEFYDRLNASYEGDAA